MKMSIGHLPNVPGAGVDFNFIIDQTEMNHDEFKFLQPVNVQGLLTNTGNEYSLTGTIRTKVEGNCSRCLEPVVADLEVEYDEIFQLEEITTEKPFIDLGKSAKDYLMVSLPVKLLCDPDCPGLCIQCGNPLKDGACDCQQMDVDPRLAALKDLFK